MKVEFRDGEKEIPDYLGEMMSGIETYKLTMDEAIREANKRMLDRHVSRAFDQIVDRHMTELRMRT